MTELTRATAERLAAIRAMVMRAIDADETSGVAETWAGPRSGEISVAMVDGAKVVVTVAAWERIS